MGRLAAGIALLLLGVVGFTDAIDLWEPREVLRYWPLALILVGAASEADALRQRRSGGGFVLIAVGVWMLAATQHLFGLRFGSAMPLGIVIVGLGLVLHAIVDVPRKKENDREPC
jgi:hypothetical protein